LSAEPKRCKKLTAPERAAAMVVHWLWDLAVFLNGAGREGPAPNADPESQLIGALMIVGPMALYGLFLVRNTRVREGWQDDLFK
jgi:hypothetical protein